MPALIEKEEITEPMRRALQHHIIRERERRMREEKEAEKDYERRAKIEEERRKKEEEDSLTLEQLKENLASLHKKHENLKEEKHQLFTQLKKVLQEEERKKQKLKEQSELTAAAHGHFSNSLPNMGSYQLMQGGHYPGHHQMSYLTLPGQSSPHGHPSMRHSLNQPHQTSPVAHPGVKRPHSPASPQPSPIQMYQRSALSSSNHSHLPSTPQHAKYDHGFSSHPGYFSMTGVANPPVTQQVIHGTPSRHISVLHTGSSSPSGRPAGQRSPYSLIKQLEIASQKSGFGDDLGNTLTPPRGRPMIRMLPQGSLLPQQVSQSPRSRSGSPGRYPPPEKSHSPFHTTNPLPGSRYYK